MATYDPKRDYQADINKAISSGNISLARELNTQRDAKIKDMGSAGTQYAGSSLANIARINAATSNQTPAPKPSSGSSSGGSANTKPANNQSSAPAPGSGEADWERYAIDNYAPGVALNSQQQAEVQAFAQKMATTGGAAYPSFMQAASQAKLEQVWQSNMDKFYETTIKNSTIPAVQAKWQQLKAQWDAMPAGAKDPSKLTPTAVGNYKGYDVTKGGAANQGREYQFDWQTGKSTGNANLANRNYEYAMDQRYGQTANVRDQYFNDLYRNYVQSGQLTDDQDTRDWFMSLKPQWDEKMGSKYGSNGMAVGYEDQYINPVDSTYTDPQASQPKADPLTNLIQNLKAPDAGANVQNISTSQVPTDSPTTGYGSASQGSDFAASFQNAMANNNLAMAASALAGRAAKLKAMGIDPATDPSQVGFQGALDQAQSSSETPTQTPTQTPTAQPVDEVGQLLEELRGKMNEEYTPPETPDWNDAQAMADDQLGGEYDKAAKELSRLIDLDTERRGIFNSPVASSIVANKQGDLQTERESNIAKLARVIMSEERANINQQHQIAQNWKQNQLSNLSSLLGFLSNRQIAEAGITGNYKGQQTMEAKQIDIDNRFKAANAEMQQAQLTGVYQGNPTLQARAQSLQEYGTKLEAALARANQFGKVTTQEDALLLGVPVGSVTFAAQEAAANRKVQYAQLAASNRAASSNNILANFNKDLQVAELTGKFPNTPAMQQYGLAGKAYTGDAKEQAEEAAAASAKEEQGKLQFAAEQIKQTYSLDNNTAAALANLKYRAGTFDQAYALATTDPDTVNALKTYGINPDSLTPYLKKMFPVANPQGRNVNNYYNMSDPSLDPVIYPMNDLYK